MLPETFAPGAEILPSVTVSVELAVGSQLPLLVTIVTFQVPSYGCWASADVAEEAAKVETKRAVAMRLRRMRQIPVMCLIGQLFEPNVAKICRVAASWIVPLILNTYR
jgi:hypothetical protein